MNVAMKPLRTGISAVGNVVSRRRPRTLSSPATNRRVVQAVRATTSSRAAFETALHDTSTEIVRGGRDSAHSAVACLQDILTNRTESPSSKVLALELLDNLVVIDDHCAHFAAIETNCLQTVAAIAASKKHLQRRHSSIAAALRLSRQEDMNQFLDERSGFSTEELQRVIDTAARVAQRWGTVFSHRPVDAASKAFCETCENLRKQGVLHAVPRPSPSGVLPLELSAHSRSALSVAASSQPTSAAMRARDRCDTISPAAAQRLVPEPVVAAARTSIGDRASTYRSGATAVASARPGFTNRSDQSAAHASNAIGTLEDRMASALQSAELVQETLRQGATADMRHLLEDVVLQCTNGQAALQLEAAKAVDSGRMADFSQISRALDEIAWALDAYARWVRSDIAPRSPTPRVAPDAPHAQPNRASAPTPPAQQAGAGTSVASNSSSRPTSVPRPNDGGTRPLPAADSPPRELVFSPQEQQPSLSSPTQVTYPQSDSNIRALANVFSLRASNPPVVPPDLTPGEEGASRRHRTSQGSFSRSNHSALSAGRGRPPLEPQEPTLIAPAPVTVPREPFSSLLLNHSSRGHNGSNGSPDRESQRASPQASSQRHSRQSAFTPGVEMLPFPPPLKSRTGSGLDAFVSGTATLPWPEPPALPAEATAEAPPFTDGKGPSFPFQSQPFEPTSPSTTETKKEKKGKKKKKKKPTLESAEDEIPSADVAEEAAPASQPVDANWDSSFSPFEVVAAQAVSREEHSKPPLAPATEEKPSPRPRDGLPFPGPRVSQQRAKPPTTSDFKFYSTGRSDVQEEPELPTVFQTRQCPVAEPVPPVFRPENVRPLPSPPQPAKAPVKEKDGDATTAHLMARIKTLETQLDNVESKIRPQIESEIRSKVEREVERYQSEAARASKEMEALRDEIDGKEHELNAAQKNAKKLRVELDRLRHLQQERESAVGQAKSMWLKESSRAAVLADQLDEAERHLADQEAGLHNMNEKYEALEQQAVALRQVLAAETFGKGPLDVAPAARSFLASGQPGSTSPEVDGRLSHRATKSTTTPHSSEVMSRRCTVPGTERVQQTSREAENHAAVPLAVAQLAATDGSVWDPFGTPAASLFAEMEAFDPHEGRRHPDLNTTCAAQSKDVQRFRECIISNDAVLFEDETLQVGVKAQFDGLHASIDFFYGNLRHCVLASFAVTFHFEDQDNLGMQVQPLPSSLGPKEQLCQTVAFSCGGPFEGCPLMRIQYLLPDNSPRSTVVLCPVAVSKFMEGRELGKRELISLWGNEHFVLKEASKIINLNSEVSSALVHVARHFQLGGALLLHHGIDSKPDNMVAVGAFPPSKADPNITLSLVIVRLEIGCGRFRGKARLSARSDSAVLSQSICALLGTQLGYQ
eukprot:Polyplicarium_translucidae@DN3270_c0_g1_i6.p1